MAQKKIVRRVCDRCSTRDVPSTVTARYQVEGISYEIDLCDRHLDMFDRDMASWTRLSTEVTETRRQSAASLLREAQRKPVDRTPVAIPAALPQAASVPERVIPPTPVTVTAADLAQAAGLDPEVASRWRLTEAAAYRMQKEGISLTEVLWVAMHPDAIRPGDVPESVVHRRGGVWAVVNPATKEVITTSKQNLAAPVTRRHAIAG